MLQRVNQLTKQITSSMSSNRKTPDINLYTSQTPNGIKISITLEELGYTLFPSALILIFLSLIRALPNPGQN